MGVAPNPTEGPYKTRKRRDTDEAEKPRGGGGGDEREAATSPGTDARSPRSWKRWEDPPLEPLQGAQPWDTLNSDIWPSGLGEDEFP